MKTIGFIGLGIMGQPMVQNLMNAGFHLVVWNRTTSKSEEMRKLGAEIGASPAELARRVDVVISCVTDSADVEQIVLGEEGVLSGVHSGLVMIVNQIIVAGTMAAVSEGLIFAAKAGADLAAVFEAVSGGAAQSWQLENLGARILNGDFDPGFMVKLQQKDLQIVLDAAQKMQLPLFTTPIINQFYRALELGGDGDRGTQSYIKMLEKMSGVEARVMQEGENL